MFTVMTLFAFLFLAIGALFLVVVAVTALKFTLNLALLPFKLLFLPIFIVAAIIKLAVLFAVGAVLVAILIPILILLAIFVGPFLLLAAMH